MSPRVVKGVPAKQGVPQTTEELNEVLGTYFSAKRRLKGFKTRLAERIKKIQDQYRLKMKPVEAELKALAEGIEIFSEAHRAEFTVDGTKSKKFPHGTVGWRLGNWYHVLTTTEEAVFAELKKKGLYDTYVVEKPELDIQKLVRDRGKLKGLESISFDQDESFFIDPPKKVKKK